MRCTGNLHAPSLTSDVTPRLPHDRSLAIQERAVLYPSNGSHDEEHHNVSSPGLPPGPQSSFRGREAMHDPMGIDEESRSSNTTLIPHCGSSLTLDPHRHYREVSLPWRPMGPCRSTPSGR